MRYYNLLLSLHVSYRVDENYEKAVKLFKVRDEKKMRWFMG